MIIFVFIFTSHYLFSWLLYYLRLETITFLLINQLLLLGLMVLFRRLFHIVFDFLKDSLPLHVGQLIPKLPHAIGCDVILVGISLFKRFDGRICRWVWLIIPLWSEIIVAAPVILTLILQTWHVLCILALTLHVTLAVNTDAIFRMVHHSGRISAPMWHFFLFLNYLMSLFLTLVFHLSALVDQTLDFVFILKIAHWELLFNLAIFGHRRLYRTWLGTVIITVLLLLLYYLNLIILRRFFSLPLLIPMIFIALALLVAILWLMIDHHTVLWLHWNFLFAIDVDWN